MYKMYEMYKIYKMYEIYKIYKIYEKYEVEDIWGSMVFAKKSEVDHFPTGNLPPGYDSKSI